MENKQDNAPEEILFQYIMNYKAYRRKMVTLRVLITLVVAGGLAGLCALSLAVGITLSLLAAVVGALFVIVAFHKEWSYTIYNTKIVIKDKDKRYVVPLDGVTAVSFKTAFYEKDLLTGTATVTVKTAKGGKRKYKLKHIFNAQEGVAFLKKTVETNNARAGLTGETKSD